MSSDQALTPLENAPWSSRTRELKAARAVPSLRPRALLFGPVGRRRSLLGLIVLSIVTLGIYPLFWFGRINRELAHFDARVHARPGRSTLAITLPWLVTMSTGAAAGARAVLSHLGIWRIDLPLGNEITRWAAAAPLATQYLVLLIPFSLVAAVMTLERLRTVEDHLEVATNRQTRPVRALGWLLLPVVGGFALMLKQQRRLNAIWDEFGD